MSEYFFGCGSGAKVHDSLGERVDAIAREHDATFVWAKMPDGWRFWFTTRDCGHPFNARTERDVLAAVEAAGIRLPRSR